MEKRFVIVADDFTGANDTGVQVKKHGIPTSVLLSVENWEQAGNSMVFDTESRIVEPQVAYERVKAVVQEVVKDGVCDFLYKKVDSTLRGNVIPEIKAMVDVFRPELVVFAPAFPKAGRTTESAMQKVNGVPLMETEFVKDPRTPVKTGNIKEMLADGLGVTVNHHELDEIEAESMVLKDGYHTFDTVYNKHMQQIAAHCLKTGKKILWIGSAGLAEGYFNEIMPNYPILAMVGSVSAKSMEQMDYAQKHNVPFVEVDMREVLDGMKIDKYVAAAVDILKEGKDLIVTAARTRDIYNEFVEYGTKKSSKEELAQLTKDTLGAIIEAVTTQATLSGLFLTGGDTAISAINRLGAQGSKIEHEILTGFVLSRLVGGKFAGMPVVTKAGGFGTEKDLYYCMYRMKEVI